MEVDVIGEIAEVELIAAGNSIRDIRRLRKQYGAGRKEVKVKRLLKE